MLDDQLRSHRRSRPRRKQAARATGAAPRGALSSEPLLGWEGRPAARPAIGFGTVPRAPAASDQVAVRGNPSLHWLGIGPTGSGKTVGLIIPQILDHPGPVFAVDVKGELYRTTSRHRRQIGQHVLRIDPFGLVPDEPSHGINPCDAIRLSPNPAAMARAMAELLSPVAEAGRDGAFWTTSGNALNGAGLELVARSLAPGEGHAASLAGWRALLHADSVAYRIAALLDAQPDLPKEMRDEFAGWLQLPDVTRGGVLATAQAALKPFGTPGLREALSVSDVDLSAVVRGEPMTVYLCWPPWALRAYAPVLRLLVGTVVGALLERDGGQDPATLVVVDEAGTIGYLPQLETAFTLARGYGVKVTMAVQSSHQIEAAYGPSARAIVDNAGLISVLPQTTFRAAAETASLLGGVSADTVMGMRSDEVLVGEAGRLPRILRRPNYLTDAVFAGRWERAQAPRPREPGELSA